MNVTTPNGASLALDNVASAHQSVSGSTVSVTGFSTTGSNELLVAFLAADGSAGQTFSSVTGGGLTWTLRQRTNTQLGTAEIWQAVASSTLSNVTITATHGGSYQSSMAVAAFTGASTTVNGAVAGANAANGAPTVSLTTTRAGSWVWGVGNDWDTAVARTVGSSQTKVDEYLASSGDTFWVQRQTSPTTTTGTRVTINDTSPTSDRWNYAAIEIIPT